MISDSEAFEVGVLVETDFSGKVTRHRIKARYKVRNCESGVMYTVEPRVPKSGGGKVDHGWFKRVTSEADQTT